MGTRHHTKDKGDLAVALVSADLIERGFTILTPLTEHAPFDLVAYLDQTFLRVQVKYRTAQNGRVRVAFESVWNDRHGTHREPMRRNDVDVVAIYCPQSRRSYYIDPSAHRASVSLRIEPARNGQSKRVLPAEQHLVMPPPTVRGVDAGRVGPLVQDGGPLLPS